LAKGVEAVFATFAPFRKIPAPEPRGRFGRCQSVALANRATLDY